jgi:hypothetical protein
MKKEVVPVYYGLQLTWSTRESAKAEFFDFPFAERFAEGGCVVLEDQPDRTEIYICPACEAAKQRWILEHPEDRWAQHELKLKKQPNQALQHNDPSCHVSCLRTPRASRGRG